MDQETLINGLAVIGALSLAYWLFRILAAVAGWVQKDAIEHDRAAEQAVKPAPAKAVAAPRAADVHEDIAEHDIAVIAAAVRMMMGNHHRVVHIQDANSGQSWSAEGRWMHQTSHKTH